MHSSYYTSPRRPFRKVGYAFLGLLVICIALVVVQLFRPIPALAISGAAHGETISGKTQLAWPSAGEAVVATSATGKLGQFGAQTPVSIASLTKLMTVHLVLQKHPLTAGQNGPTITMTAKDVQIYNQDKATQSVMKITKGQQLTERQLLEGLMLPSANNLATVLANWTDGSTSAFIQEMNQEAKQLGMTHTSYADVSGANPASVSTAADQLKILKLDMQNPVLRNIVDQAQATIPGTGTIYNSDYVIRHDGIIGFKTGSSSEAGGCFAFVAQKQIAGQNVYVYGDILHQGGIKPLITALHASESLIQSTAQSLSNVSIIKKGQTLGTLTSTWHQKTPVVAGKSLSILAEGGQSIHIVLQPNADLKAPIVPGTQVGTAVIRVSGQTYKIPLIAEGRISKPSYKWRLLRL